MDDQKTAETAALEQETKALASGEIVGSYRIERVLGAGGFGVTYLVSHVALDKFYALKEYFPDGYCYREGKSAKPSQLTEASFEWGLTRFITEAKVLAKFDAPSIVKVFDIFEANGTAYMVLAYEEGMNLRRWAGRLGRPATQEELDKLFKPLLAAVDLLHTNSLLHRDIAPDNIIIRPDGSPVLIDFGSARPDARGASGPVSTVVKAGYSPLEQYLADASQQGPWTDIYALGATLYFLVTGKSLEPPQVRPENATSPTQVDAKPGYREGFLKAVDWALSIKPKDRPQSIMEWSEALFAVPQTKASKSTPLLAAAGALCALGAAFAITPIRCSALDWKCSKVIEVAPPATPTKTTEIIPAPVLTPTPPTPSTPSAAPELRLELSLPKTKFVPGDSIEFAVRSNQDCYFLVYTIEPSGVVKQHDPNTNRAAMGDPLLKAGEWRDIPAKGFKAKIDQQMGEFELGALCSLKPLSEIGLTEFELKSKASAGRRSFTYIIDRSVQASKSTVKETTRYDVRAKEE